MKFLHVTDGMCGFSPCDEEDILELCKFFGMTEEQVKEDMFYFTHGEGFNFNGWTTSLGSETEHVISPNDVLVFTGKVYTKLPPQLSALEQEYNTAERMEPALMKVLESGELSKEMEKVVKLGLGWTLTELS